MNRTQHKDTLQHESTLPEAEGDDFVAFVVFIVANTSTDPAHALTRLLPDFYGCPALYGKAFSLALDARGQVEAVVVLSPTD